MHRFLRPVAGTLTLLLVLLFASAQVHAAGQRGLQINPLRDFQTVKAGQQKTGQLSVTNLSSEPEVITMSIKTFSVANYTYDYQFSAPSKDWITFSKDRMELAPGDTQTVTYFLAPDAKATPGGYYYTLAASTTVGGNGSTSTVQAATLLYVTISGTLDRAGGLDDAAVQRLVFGRDIGYSIDARNTGNVHYFVSISTKLFGIFAREDSAPTSHLLMPGTVRRIDGELPSPLLPGLYRVAITTSSEGGVNDTTSRYLLYLPPWFFAVVLGAFLLYRGTRKPKPPKKHSAKKAAEEKPVS